MPSSTFRFGPFQFMPGEPRLLRGGEPVHVGNRALQVLALLVENAGKLVANQTLVKHVWPSTIVEEGNLRAQIAALRKVLEDGKDDTRYVVNEPGRGYRFIADVVRDEYAAAVPANSGRTHGVPILLTRLIGRDAVLAQLACRLSRERLLTIVGAGGSGKTSLALAVAAQVEHHYAEGACFVDLSAVIQSELVPSAVASALQLPMPNAVPMLDLVGGLRDRQMLLVLDNCEHVADGVASMAEALLRACPALTLLATSREPLRAQSERLWQLAPLDTPMARSVKNADAAMAFPAVQLFVERASTGSNPFVLDDQNAAVVAALCRKLDGLPLALELGAACVRTLGIETLMDGLDDRLALLTQGPRTNERHRSLRAMLDWSYAQLSAVERSVFCRLAVFRNTFTLDAVLAVVQVEGVRRVDILRALTALSDKSLLAVDCNGHMAVYRLLDTTRAYALERLEQSGDEAAVRRQHANHLLASLDAAETDWQSRARADWWELYGQKIDDVRAALDWCFADAGDGDLGVALTIASASLWLGLSKLDEFGRRIEQALARLLTEGKGGGTQEMQLQTLLSTRLYYTSGPSSQRSAALTRVLQIAQQRGDIAAQVTALWNMMGDSHVCGDDRTLATHGKQMEALVSKGGAGQAATVERLRALTDFRLGPFKASLQQHVASELPARLGALLFRNHFRYNPRATALANRAGILWLSGYAERAQRHAEAAVVEALSLHDPPTLCYVLSHFSCPLALWMGDLVAARRQLDTLIEHTSENGFLYLRRIATLLEAALALQTGEAGPSRPELRADFEKLFPFHRELLITVAPQWVDETRLPALEAQTPRWSTAEMLRASGEALLRDNGPASEHKAQALFGQAIALARAQGALAWELRAATSLARLHYTQGATTLARDGLAAVLNRFEEGWATADVRTAQGLFDRMR